MSKTYQCLVVSELPSGEFSSNISHRDIGDLPQEGVLVRVHYSSVNYKDALSATGNKGVTRQYPHTPGIDAAGMVEISDSPDWKAGDQVIVTGFDLGMNTSGGFAEYIKVPARWLVKLPAGLSLKESMIYGTAGFTAGISVEALIRNGITPDKGIIAVTGATGGVGSLAIGILHKLGYTVAAISSKVESNEFLTAAGASEIISRKDVEDTSGKVLLKPKFAGAIDSVGGEVLATLLKSVNYGGTVTACGMVNGANIPITVFPFILRGIQLAGVDSVEYPIEKRTAIWQNLATDWKPGNLEMFANEIGLAELPECISKILEGKMQGRSLLNLDKA